MSPGGAREFWWTAGDSNPRPPRCERDALPAELAAHGMQMLQRLDYFSRDAYIIQLDEVRVY